MPDAVGMDLQSAQDLLQDTAGNFLYYSSSEDATGEGRMQLMDSNWVVCSQNVAPGATVTDDLNVIFYVVSRQRVRAGRRHEPLGHPVVDVMEPVVERASIELDGCPQ